VGCASVRIDGESGGVPGSALTRRMRSSTTRDLRDEPAAIKAAAEALQAIFLLDSPHTPFVACYPRQASDKMSVVRTLVE